MTAVLLHGAGSCPATAVRLLAPLAGRGAVAPEVRAGVDAAVAALVRLVDEHRPDVVAGVSLGAHAAAVWAATTGSRIPLALVLPAWTGAPAAVADATAAAADELERRGSRAVLDSLRSDPAARGDWVVDELESGWATYADDDLVASLRAAAASAGPTREQLASLRGPVAVVALADDPLHPEQVAAEWADLAPRSALVTVARRAPDHDRAALGRAAADALGRLSGSR